MGLSASTAAGYKSELSVVMAHEFEETGIVLPSQAVRQSTGKNVRGQLAKWRFETEFTGSRNRQLGVFCQQSGVGAWLKVISNSAAHAVTANPALTTGLLDHVQGGC